MQLKRLVLAAILVTALILGSTGTILAQGDGEAPAEGVWQTDGYGLVMDAADGQVTLYEITAVSCLPFYQGAYENWTIPDLEVTVTAEPETGALVIEDGMTLRIVASPLPELPALCADGGTPETGDPELNFEVFWHTFNEHYAFFDLYGVDWQARYDEYRQQVTPDTTPGEMFTILSDLIAPLNDGHIFLFDGSDVFLPGAAPDWYEEYGPVIYAFGESRYFSGDAATVTGNGLLAYQLLSDSVGYINILQMEGFGETELDELDVAAAAIDQALADLGAVDTLIVDVRYNGGGHDAVALTFASRFADSERLAYSKHARSGDTFTPLYEFTVRPDGPQQFTGSVIVLTSRLTASAAEIFVMAMQPLPHVTIMGEPTSGSHSDILSRILPNGWHFSLSNEIYYASDGEVYESIGLQPDIPADLNAPGFADGIDSMLDEALALAAAG
jgi:carboxyl-terminal processing protease